MSVCKSAHRALAAAAVLGLLCGPPAASADVMVDAVATADGANFLYQVTITNDTPDDLSIVSIVDAPVGDPFVDPSLTAPADYFALYDGGLGIIDFVEDILTFAAGAAVSGFSFVSAAAPDTFGSFEAFTVDGDLLFGQVNFAALAEVSEPATLAALLAGLLLIAALRYRRRAAIGLLGLMAAGPALAASHSDAPLIKQDPQANITDVYAFVGRKFNEPDDEVLNVLVQVRPFSEPGDGPHYDAFADDAVYSIHITHPVTGQEALRYDFRFSDVAPKSPPLLKNPDTILSYGLGTEVGAILNIGDVRQNFLQTYSVTKRVAGGSQTTLGTEMPVAPPNVGLNVTPGYNDPVTGRAISGATTEAELDPLTREAVQELPSGESTFAGPRDDGFFADVPGIFDLLDARILNTDGNGVNGFKGFNVLGFAIQIPLSDLPSQRYVDNLFGPGTGVGVYASVSRPRLTIRSTRRAPVTRGPFIQVNRMGNPLFNEAFVALLDKDKYNRTSPEDDELNFGQYALTPELAALINAVVGTDIATTNRTDLAAVFVPDILRVETTTGPVNLSGDPGFRRLSFLDGDGALNSEGFARPGGFPNGRRLADDVIDIALTVLGSGPTFQTLLPLGDNVNENDIPYNRVFPFMATPHAGTNNRKDPFDDLLGVLTQ